LLALSKTPVHAAQNRPNKGDSEDGTLFLVARPELGDPFFKESVVLMFPSSVVEEEGLVVGLIVNRPARVSLSEIFPKDNVLKNRSETAYFGGPVDPQALGIVFRSSKPAKQAALLFGDVYVSFDPDFIKEVLKNPEKTPDLRLFVGRSQWVPAQLQNEVVKGAWYSVRAETNLIFSASPQYLWRKLFERAEPFNVAKVSNLLFDLSANLTVGVRQVKDRLAATYPRQGSRSPVPGTDPSGLVSVQRTCFQIVPGREVGGEGRESPVKEESRARWVFGHGSEKKPSERSSRGFGESGCQA